MFYNVLKAKETVNLDNKKLDKKILMENNESSFSTIAIKKDEIIHLFLMRQFMLLTEKLNYILMLKNLKLIKEKFLCLKKTLNTKLLPSKIVNSF